jgi:hypothetical protein
MWIHRGSKFAIYFEVGRMVDEWVLGSFFLGIGEAVVGNRLDQSVDLKGCLRWWRDFVNCPRNRYEPGLFDASKETVFLLLASSVLATDDQSTLMGEYYPETFSRFHISQVGMSSFDNVTMLFLKSEIGLERLVWRVSDGDISDAYFEPGEIEGGFTEAAASLEHAVIHHNGKPSRLVE